MEISSASLPAVLTQPDWPHASNVVPRGSFANAVPAAHASMAVSAVAITAARFIALLSEGDRIRR